MENEIIELTESKTLKLGKMKLSIEFLKEMYGNPQLKHVMGNFIVLDAVTNWETEIVEYVCVSDFFTPIVDTDEIPLYSLDTSESKNDASEKVYTFSVTKV